MFSARQNRKAQFHNGLISECKLSGGNIGQLFCVQKSAFRGDRQFFQQTILIQKRKPPGRIVFSSAVSVISRTGPGAEDHTVQGKGNVRRPYIAEPGGFGTDLKGNCQFFNHAVIRDEIGQYILQISGGEPDDPCLAAAWVYEIPWLIQLSYKRTRSCHTTGGGYREIRKMSHADFCTVSLQIRTGKRHIYQKLIPVFYKIAAFLCSVCERFIPEFYQPGFSQKIKVRGQGCNRELQALCNLLNVQTFFFLDQTQNLYTDRGTESFEDGKAIRNRTGFHVKTSF